MITETLPEPVEAEFKSKNKRLFFLLLGLVAVLAAAAGSSYFYLKNKKVPAEPVRVVEEASPSPAAAVDQSLPPPASPLPSPSLKPSPKPLPHGQFDFSVSQSDKTKPQFSQGTVNPYDPAVGTAQTVTISVNDEQPITQVSAQVKTDNKLAGPFAFKLISGNAASGTWQGSWTISDSYDATFHLILSATSSRGTSTIDITLR